MLYHRTIHWIAARFLALATTCQGWVERKDIGYLSLCLWLGLPLSVIVVMVPADWLADSETTGMASAAAMLLVGWGFFLAALIVGGRQARQVRQAYAVPEAVGLVSAVVMGPLALFLPGEAWRLALILQGFTVPPYLISIVLLLCFGRKVSATSGGLALLAVSGCAATIWAVSRG